jgi:hypothetical protein
MNPRAEVTAMRRQVLLVFCWVVMFGNVVIAIPTSTVAHCYPELLSVEMEVFVVALLSFWCALILRGRVVRSTAQSPPESAREMGRPVSGTVKAPIAEHNDAGTDKTSELGRT